MVVSENGTAAPLTPITPITPNDIPISSSSAAPDSKSARVVLTQKIFKKREREAKEKEYADGQHPNMIYGVWHCSNCGCPESIAVGSRKGPLGDKSQCGTCGKFWHRHRRPRPVEYNSDAEYHLNLVREAEQVRVAAKRRHPPAWAVDERAKRGQDDGEVQPATPVRPNSETWVDVPPAPQTVATTSDSNQAASPVSTASSASESPLAQRIARTNGAGHSRSAPPDAEPQQAALSAAPPTASPQPARPSAPPNSSQPISVPRWLKDAMKEMQARYPDDRFEVTQRKGNPFEFRLKCLD
ncbi:uncharacterized protein LAESUDRAFT_752702 [Laetiporus sulphureus 93-53]|uniref:GATA-type domain-containing protein n=1 Tax=Laetiporus sulphureus 93-53 TaxID=1314785 RepID=A0A165BMG9_9APHY|nr:uncharacterized protein LAESUDRAFT_752702 [Laetiporus sulphureus 93-53]KZT01310.1 hypothetical protein LAESUDRAFT_752702 [Laetiporus sulphureus 93-53]